MIAIRRMRYQSNAAAPRRGSRYQHEIFGGRGKSAQCRAHRVTARR
jgi:hypothetical protein